MTRLRELAAEGGQIVASAQLFRAHQPGQVGGNGAGAVFGGTHPIIAGTISTSANDAVTRTCDLTLAGDPPGVTLRDGFAPNGAYIRVQVGIVDPVTGSPVVQPAGVFIIEDVEIGRGTVRLQGYDLGWHVANNPRDRVTAYGTDTTLRTAIFTELERHMPAFLWQTTPPHPDAPLSTPALSDWAILGQDPAKSPMVELRELAADYGFRLFFWTTGVAALVPNRALTRANAVAAFTEGETSTLIGVQRRLKGLTPNRAVGRFRVGEGGPQHVVVAEDRAPNSPTHTDLYQHTVTVPGGVVDHLSEAEAAVQAELDTHRGMADTLILSVSAGQAALLEPYDIVTVRSPRLGVTADTPYRVESTRFDLAGGESEAVVWRRVGVHAHTQIGGGG